MDAATLCALMLKAKRVFGNEQTFLSFPLSPVPFTRRDLDFFDDSTKTAAQISMRNQIEFSRQVNLIPTGEAWLPAATGFLWDAYLSVLTQSDVAQSARTATEEAAYNNAKALLRDANGDDTDIVKAYKQHRDAFIVCQEKYLAAKLTAESANESEREQWRSIIEPAMKAELDTLSVNWMLLGNKTKVEDAQNLITILGAHSPSQMLAEWRSRCNPDLDQLTDPSDLTSAFVTSFSPANAVDENAWCSFTLSPAEIASLLASAPTEWRRTMLGDATPSTTQSVTFEFSSAGIIRPWFDANAFKSRFWRFDDPSRLLSDGLNPPSGECTAYASGIVFARHVRTIDTAQPGNGATQPFTGLQFKMAALTLQSKSVEIAALPAADVPAPAAIRATAIAQPRMAMRDTVALAAGTPAMRLMRADRMADVSPELDWDAPPSVRNFQKMKRLRGISVYRPPLEPPPQAPAPPPAPASPPPAAPDETIYVLAFICKKVGKAPDPDASLSW
jgi:hypothetical protein